MPDGHPGTGGALSFGQDASVVRVAHRPVLDGIAGIVIEVWLRAQSNGARRNILEADGSFALFIDPDDNLTASAYATVDGGGGPGWYGFTAPLTHGRWHKIVFQHDGITRSRLIVDDEIVGERDDYNSGLVLVASTGIAIGNWTLDERYPFRGEISRVRIFKRDAAAPIEEFSGRPMAPEGRDTWTDIWGCIGSIGGAEQELAGQHALEWEALLRELFRAVLRAGDDDRERFRDIAGLYTRRWREGVPDARALVALRDAIVDLVGQDWLDRATDLADRAAANIGGECVDPDRLRATDPAFAACFDDLQAML